MIRRAAAAALLVSLAGTRPATAQTSAAERTLHLDEVLARAKAGNRDLKAAAARVDQSRSQITQAWAALLPLLIAQGRYTHNNKSSELDLAAQNAPLLGFAEVLKQSAPPSTAAAIDQFEADLTANTPGTAVILKREQLDGTLAVTVPLVVPSGYAGLSASRRLVEAQEANFDASAASILFQVAQTFFGTAGADELIKVREHGIEVASETLENAKARFDSGLVNRVEVTRAELALVQARQALLETRDAQAQLYRALGTLIALKDPFRVEPPPEGKAAGPTIQDLPALIDVSLPRRPEVTALERSIDASDALENAALWRWAPTLSAFGSGRLSNYSGFSGDQFSWAVGATLDWTIFDGGLRIAQQELAQAQRAETEALLDQLRDRVGDEIADALRMVDTKEAALLAAHRSVDLSTETLELVRAQHDAGTATQIDLLQAQDALISSEVAVAQARFDLSLAQLSLARATGVFPENQEPHS